MQKRILNISLRVEKTRINYRFHIILMEGEFCLVLRHG